MFVSKEFIEQIVLEYGKDMQHIVCIEELSELQKELTKALRSKANLECLSEEIAHCLISISMIMHIYDIKPEMVDEKIEQKINQYK